MKTLVISKPVYDCVLPLVEFPLDGDKFYIDNSIKSLSNIGSLVAITLAKYNEDVSFTGMIGEDPTGSKIKEIFGEYKIDTSYIETSYTEKTCVSYKIYNSKTNKFTSIEEYSLKNNLTKYKYEFIPDVIIMDDRDYPANLAAINNYPESKMIYIGEKYTKESSVYCNKCKYILCNLKFASDATGVVNDLNKPKNIITLFQKYIDLYNSNLIIRLDNFDILYCIDDEVRLIKNINKTIANKENVFYSVLCYFLIQNIDIENSIKLTNKVMLSSNSELDMIKNIPDYKIVNECLEEYKKFIEDNKIVENNKDNIETNQSGLQENQVVSSSQTYGNTNNNVGDNIGSQVNINNNSQTINTNINSNDQVVKNNVQPNTDTPIINNTQSNANNGVNDVERL